MTGHDSNVTARRATLRAFARWGVCGLCVAGSGFLAATRGSFAKGRECPGDGFCAKCDLLKSCELPQARPAKGGLRE